MERLNSLFKIGAELQKEKSAENDKRRSDRRSF